MKETSFSEIKAIPKYIEKRIMARDKKEYSVPQGHTRFYAYLAIWHKELIKITVAVRHYREKWYCKQVAVHGIHWNYCYIKDIDFYFLAGYVVGWSKQGISRRRYYESTNWYACEDKYFDPYAPVVNLEVIDKFPKYKYSAYKLYPGVKIFKYLRLYEQFPQIEYLMKTGLANIAMSKTILRKCGKDKNFCKWLIAHKDDIRHHRYYVITIIKAYSTGKTLQKTQETESLKKAFYSDSAYRDLRGTFKDDAVKFMRYLKEQKISVYVYKDYFKACVTLGVDMALPKNRYPHEFKRWHDIRIDEYATIKINENKNEKEQFNKTFAAVAEKYSALQYNKKDAYICIIAKSPEDLIYEGETLHHCVGTMNYDQRFIKEQSLIFFIRTRENPDVSFVTLEYSLVSHKVLQCYGDDDTKPNDEVLHYVNKIWLPYANRNIKLIA